MNKRLIVNLGLVYVIWGSTYLAIALAVKEMPPLIAMGTRFIFAALIMGAWLTIKNGVHSLAITTEQFFNVFVMGGLLLGGANGSVAAAERYAPSGIVAILISLLPVWILIMRTISGDRPSRWGFLGVVIGLLGVFVLLKPGSIIPLENVSEGTMIWWCFIALMGNLGWALGSFLAPKFSMPTSSYVATFYQLLAGGIILVAIASMTGESFSDWRQASATAWWSWLYLALIGSIVAYSAYFWLVRNAPIGLTSTYAYINPVIAIIFGVIFLGETINANYLFGGGVVLLGVLLVVTSESKRVKRS